MLKKVTYVAFCRLLDFAQNEGMTRRKMKKMRL
jgi:hypothetical protein